MRKSNDVIRRRMICKVAEKTYQYFRVPHIGQKFEEQKIIDESFIRCVIPNIPFTSCLWICLFCLFVYFICLFVCLFIFLLVCSFICLFSIYLLHLVVIKSDPGIIF